MDKELRIVDYTSRSKDGMVLPFRFTIQDGWYPLLAIPPTYKGVDNPYFPSMNGSRMSSRVRISMSSSGLNYKYKKGRRYGSSPVILYSGFLSAMGVAGDFDFMPSTLTGSKIHYRMKGEIDLFCLAVVPVNHLPEIGQVTHSVHSRYMKTLNSIYVKTDLTKVKLLVSTEKLRKSLFMKDRYTATIRTNILNQIKRLDTDSAITVEDVPDDYLNGFAISPNAVRTNSIVEIIQLDNEIKDSVFSNLNKVAI
jgi:hypothetical protein